MITNERWAGDRIVYVVNRPCSRSGANLEDFFHGCTNGNKRKIKGFDYKTMVGAQ